MINTRFDLVLKLSSKDHDRTFKWLMLPQVPNAGEVINLDGHPYVVHDRDWAVDDAERLFAYVRVLTAEAPPWLDAACSDGRDD